jgi:cell division protease FtsH
MSERLGPVYYEHGAEHPFLGRRLATDSGTSDATVHVIEEETRQILLDAVNAATSQLQARRDLLDRLVNGLLEHETLEVADLIQLLGPGPG